ncbi:conserved hypothetical protein [Ricinus communis]|uniref:Uncharacterized protein n=1 Tax=Ricinus communis TaxID=3988 RepID=B9RJE3_RICCO|nr:conserved hypothetical protein [Ricinus communis]
MKEFMKKEASEKGVAVANEKKRKKIAVLSSGSSRSVILLKSLQIKIMEVQCA